MDFFDNVVKSSNALLKERLNNPFGAKQSSSTEGEQQQQQASTESKSNQQQQPTETGSSNETSNNNDSSSEQTGGENGQQQDKNSQFAAIAADAEAVTQKAVKGAKDFGSFLFSMANKAGQTVTQTAKQVKQAVENTSILTDFTREQQDFIKEHGGSMQAGELPWANCEDETKASDIREQVLSLSQDKRNFVRNPPNDANFQFDPQQCYPIALSLLKEDPNLSKMRFELVPKLVNEDTFWRNYFYRVSMLKQMSDKGENIKGQGWASSRSSSGEGPDELNTTIDDPTSPSYNTTTLPAATTTTTTTNNNQQDYSSSQKVQDYNYEISATTTTNDYLASQDLESNDSSKLFAEADDLKSKLKELNIGSLDDGGGQDEEDNNKWEEELQRDLQEFELVSGDVSALDEEVLDNEIMELKKTSKSKTDK